VLGAKARSAITCVQPDAKSEGFTWRMFDDPTLRERGGRVAYVRWNGGSDVDGAKLSSSHLRSH